MPSKLDGVIRNSARIVLISAQRFRQDNLSRRWERPLFNLLSNGTRRCDHAVSSSSFDNLKTDERPNPIIDCPCILFSLAKMHSIPIINDQPCPSESKPSPNVCWEINTKKIKFEVRLEAVQKNQCSVDSAQPHQRPAHCGPEARLAFISKILEQADLSPEKVQKLTRKKEKLQQRLKQKSESTVSEEPKICHPRPHGHCARRWNERPTKTEETDWTNNCGFFGFGPFAKLEMIQNLLENPDLSPEKRERLMHKKEILQNRIEERQNHCEQKCFRRCQRNAQPEDDLPPCRRLNRGRK